MSKSSKKKGKVPKITEAEYAQYIASLKEEPFLSTELEKGSVVRENILREK